VDACCKQKVTQAWVTFSEKGGKMKKKLSVAVVSILLLVAFTLPSSGVEVSAGLFQSPPPTGPENDNFADAIVINELPFEYYVDTSAASLEADEPTPSCTEPFGGSIWYAYTPTEGGMVSAHVAAWDPIAVAAYSGDASNLLEVGCSCCWGEWLTFQAEEGTTYYFQVGVLWAGGWSTFYLEVTPAPEAYIYFYPYDPSVFDTVQFYDNSWDPVGVGFESQVWDFGDGAMGEGCCPTHQYAADGDYAVQLTVTTYDGRSASTSQTVSVRTHDVAIIKFSVPKAATAGQTRSIVVGLNSKRYPERVHVELQKSVPGGYEWVGSLIQSVPVRPANRTTDFRFNYTFTAADARMGKVTFRAVAYVQDAQDALPADNEAISTPTKVTR
jgi:PKD repeat protein